MKHQGARQTDNAVGLQGGHISHMSEEKEILIDTEFKC